MIEFDVDYCPHCGEEADGICYVCNECGEEITE